MNEVALLLFESFALIMVVMWVLWMISIVLGDVSFVDSFWAFGFVLIAVFVYASASTGGPRPALLVGLTSAWGLRLGLYLLWRWHREGPDGRYVALLRRAAGKVHWTSLRKVFGLQGPLLWVVSLPVQLGQLEAEPSPLGPLAALGTLVALVGLAFETIGDWQLARFKADPANAGQVMDRGLWRYTRHPNYFGDTCVWWGLFLIAAEAPLGWLSVVGPLLLTWILVRWSGAPLLERRLHRSRPGYQAYVERTSGFVPWWPREGGE